MPTYVASGTVANLTAAGGVALPAGIAVDDILLLEIETANQAVTITAQNGGTWVEVTNSPQGTGSAASATATRLTVFWSRYNGTQGAPTISDSGDHQIGRVHAFRGCKTTGDPWNITSGNVEAASDTSLSATGATTTAANCLVCIMASLMDDAQNFGATWTNASLANITVRQNSSGTAGNDGRHILVTGEKATAGTYNATTNTLTANSVKAMMTIALEGAATAYVLACDAVSVGLSMIAMTPLAARLLTAAAVSVGITVADASVLKGSRLAADPPSVTATIAEATLTYTPGLGEYLLECEPVSVGITVADAGVTATRLLATDPVAVTTTIAAAGVTATRLLATAPVSVAVTVADASLERGYLLTADPVSAAITIVDAGLTYEPAGGYVLACDPVSTAVTVAAASLLHGYAVQAAPVAVAVTIADHELVHTEPAGAVAVDHRTIALVEPDSGTVARVWRHGSSVMDTYTCDNDGGTCDTTTHTADDAPMREWHS